MRPCPSPAPLAAAAALVAFLAVGEPQGRADDGESALSVRASISRFTIPDHQGTGPGLGIDYERGLGDAFWLRASGGGATYGGGEAGLVWAGGGTLGLVYVVDVLKYVPYLHLGAGAVWLGGDEVESDLRPVAEIGAGIDILARRGLSYGGAVRLASFLDDSSFVDVGLRVTWRWGFF